MKTYRKKTGWGKKSQKNITLTKKDDICKKIIEFGILGLIFFSPLPAASVPEWSILIIQTTVLIMFASYVVMREKPRNSELISTFQRWPKYLFFGLFAFILLQIIPLPKLLVKIFSPHTYSFKELYSLNIAEMQFMSFSLIPSHTLREGLEILSYFLLGFLIIRTVTQRRQIIRIFSVLIVMGVFESFYGLFELYNKNPRILFYEKIHSIDSVTGTFVNRNHLSGYLEMIIPLAIGLLIARMGLFSLTGLSWKEKLFRLSEKGFSKNLIISFGIILMSMAIMFSRSRTSVFLLFFTFLLFFGFTVFYFGSAMYQNKWIKNFLSISFIIIILISLYVGVSGTVERFALDELIKDGRPIFWGTTLRIFSGYPFLGTGLGTFPSLYPDIMRDNNPVGIFHAHNDYLEYLAELGVFGFMLLLAGVLFLVILSFLRWKKRMDPEVKALALGGFVSLSCILIHSFTDFNLHIPANMLLFSVVISLTVATTFSRRDDEVRKKKVHKY